MTREVKGEMLDDTWSYNFSNGEWSDLDPKISPPRRSHHAMVYHPDADKIMVYGGELDSAYSNIVTDKLWLYDPNLNEWSQRQPNTAIEEVKLSSTWMKTNKDTLTFTVRILNSMDFDLTSKIFIQSADENYLDSLILYDDGNHGDGAPQDRTWGTFIKPLNIETDCLISLRIQNNEFYEQRVYKDITKFTTNGPVVFDHFEITSTDTVPTAGDQIKIRMFLRNDGSDKTASSINAKLTSPDPGVTARPIIPGLSYVWYGNIAAGENIESEMDYPINFNGPFDKNIYLVTFALNIRSNDYSYWIDTLSIYVGIERQKGKPISKDFTLYQNYPNPFNPNTTIEFALPETDEVTLKIFNILGEEIELLVSDRLNAGSYSYQ